MSTKQERVVYRWNASDFSLGTSYAGRTFMPDSWPAHSHPEYCVKICLRGRIGFVIEGRDIVLEEGEMVVHNPGQLHQSWYGYDGFASDAIGLFFDTAVVNRVLRKISLNYFVEGQRPFFLGKFRDDKVLSLVHELVRELEAREACYEEMMHSLVIQILVGMLRECLKPTFVPAAKGSRRQLAVWEMNRAMDYMIARGKTSFNQAEMCAVVGTSHSRFVPLFRNSTGLSPHVYFDRLLMQKAKRYLAEPGNQIKSVAYELGFQDVSHFCKVFRQIEGLSPGGYQLATSSACNDSAKKGDPGRR